MKKNILQNKNGEYVKFLPTKYSEKEYLEFTSNIQDAEVFTNEDLDNMDWLEPQWLNQEEPIIIIGVFV